MKSMKEYWNNRYASGETSGEGSIGNHRAFKWSIIDSYVPEIQYVFDFGCGDISFWEGRDCQNYIGFDGSKVILERNKILRPNWFFINKDLSKPINHKSNVVFCFDVLFHIMDEDKYISILKNLCGSSCEYIFIYTWNINPFAQLKYKLNLLRALKLTRFLRSFTDNTTDFHYQKYRDFNDYRHIFEDNGFRIIGMHPEPKAYGAMYVFKKLSS